MSKWARVALGEIFTIARGGSPRPIDAFITDDPAGVNWIMIGDAAEGSKYITATKKRIRKEGVSHSREVRPGDFLLTNSMSFGRPYILATAGCIHDGWLVLSPRTNDVDRDYFYHLLGSPLIFAEFERLAAGAVVKNLNSELVRGVKVPLPPLREQRRIADTLDKADAVRSKRKEAIALTEELLRSAFLEMFGDPVTNLKVWPVKRLGALLGFLTSGSRGWARHYADAGETFLRIQNVRKDRMDLSDVAYVNAPDSAEKRRTETRPGDVLLSITADLGRTAVVPDDLERAFINQHLAILRPRNIDAEYLSTFLASEGGQRQISKRNKGGVKAGLNFDDIRSIEVPVPDDDMQRAFASVKHRIRGVEADSRKALELQDNLFGSLVSCAFAGSAEAAC